MIANYDTKMTIEFFGEVSIYFGIGIQVIFALVLGGLVGYDREVKMKAAGFKTNIMICLGATLYTTISLITMSETNNMVDPNRVAAQIVSGIGFLGAGAIIQGKGNVTGLTTAATIWVVAAIGYTIGAGHPIVATVFSITVLVVLRMLNPINKVIERERDYSLFHIELISYGQAFQIVHTIIENEKVEIVNLKEGTFGNEGMYISDIFVKGHSRAIERVSNEINDALKIKKVNYREIASIPTLDETPVKSNNS
jgi:putative Mg2+ transporter-C (MgtC) family protein